MSEVRGSEALGPARFASRSRAGCYERVDIRVGWEWEWEGAGRPKAPGRRAAGLFGGAGCVSLGLFWFWEAAG